MLNRVQECAVPVPEGTAVTVSLVSTLVAAPSTTVAVIR